MAVFFLYREVRQDHSRPVPLECSLPADLAGTGLIQE